MNHRKPRIYVAGPISKGDRRRNIANAIHAAEQLMQAGAHAFVPHLNCEWDDRHRHSLEEWLEYDFAWLALCDALVRLSGESEGSDREVAEAWRLGIPVFWVELDFVHTRLDHVRAWIERWRRMVAHEVTQRIRDEAECVRHAQSEIDRKDAALLAVIDTGNLMENGQHGEHADVPTLVGIAVKGHRTPGSIDGEETGP